ncbi:MAG: (2Fe-2S)-binding protein [Myxococcota bacterium]|nr:(2Fe-2S)-binding protein [Myxococcota bacterium]
MKYPLSITVNGTPYSRVIDAKTTLVEFLRQELGLTGTKIGCAEGECGACTVLIDGIPMTACCVLALEAHGHHITTIEGLADGPDLHPIQSALIKTGAVQCGYCTPGMALSIKALLDQTPDPTATQVRQALSGNLCRCTGYQKIIEAALAAAAMMAEQTGKKDGEPQNNQ